MAFRDKVRIFALCLWKNMIAFARHQFKADDIDTMNAPPPDFTGRRFGSEVGSTNFWLVLSDNTYDNRTRNIPGCCTPVGGMLQRSTKL